MGFPAAFIDELKSRCDLVEIASRSVVLSKKGNGFSGLCPFHDDKSPSLKIMPLKQKFKCWACDAKGDVIDWVMKTDDCDFYSAVKSLSAFSGLALPVEDTAQLNETDAYLKSLRNVLLRAFAIYQHGLEHSPAAIEYLTETRRLSRSNIKYWGLGVVSKGISPFLKATEQDLLNVGILGKNDDGKTFERLRQRITIPIHNSRGQLIGFSGRQIDGGLNSGAKYLNPPTTELFKKQNILFGLNKNSSAIHKSQLAIVVEGYFDVISLKEQGENRAVAGMGTALTHEQLRLLYQVTPHIVFCYDGDSAGRKAVLRLLPNILKSLRDKETCAFLFLPDGLDPDEFVIQRGIDAWRQLLAKAEPLSQLLLRYITKNSDNLSVEEKMSAVLRAKTVTHALENAPLYRQLITNEIYARFGISLELT